MTPYRLLLSRVGLSQADAAALHDVRLDTVKSWCAGRNRAPTGVIAGLPYLTGLVMNEAITAEFEEE